MSTVPRSPYPDGDRSILACPSCGSGEYLWNEDGNRNHFCGQCGQAIDWGMKRPGRTCGSPVIAVWPPGEQAEETDMETQRELLAREIKNGKFGPNCYILNPQEDPAAVKALRALCRRD